MKLLDDPFERRRACRRARFLWLVAFSAIGCSSSTSDSGSSGTTGSGTMVDAATGGADGAQEGGAHDASSGSDAADSSVEADGATAADVEAGPEAAVVSDGAPDADAVARDGSDADGGPAVTDADSAADAQEEPIESEAAVDAAPDGPTCPVCASGVCNASFECDRCQNDQECAAGRVCGSGTCGARCMNASDCGGGASVDCCDGHCIDLTKDIANCGACATLCNATQFCGSAGCAAVSFANICANLARTELTDDLELDDTAAAIMQDALGTACSPAPTASTISQSTPGPINADTGQPVTGGNDLIVTAGGYFVNTLVGYLDSNGITPVYLSSSGNDISYLQRGAGADASPNTIKTVTFDQIDGTHDIIVIELARDPASGTLSLVTWGLSGQGTIAGAFYFANHMLPNRASFTDSWYVYEWTSAGAADAAPSDADTFTLLASGQ